MITDAMLFYGGIVLAGVALVLLIVCLAVGRVRFKRLRKRLEDEYGPQIR